MEAPSNPLLWVTLVTMLVGLAGSVLPGLPGVPLIFLSALVYAILTDFEYVGTLVIVLLGLFAAIALVADFVATTYGARRFGASNWGTVGGAVGGIVGALVGALFLGIGALFGLILGSVGGIFLGEYLKRRGRGAAGEPSLAQAERWDWRRASRAAGGVFVGYVVSAVTQGLLGLLSVIVFVLALFN
ncbi:MAG: DUF456 domain-containing protein [Actinobacteria bacterium]|nr:DUF456 domain-containing protein [Actinomycetota bacterium]